MNKITAFLLCLCIALGIAYGLERQKRIEVEEQNARMERQVKEISSQVNEIWNEYMGVMKRVQNYGNHADK